MYFEQLRPSILGSVCTIKSVESLQKPETDLTHLKDDDSDKRLLCAEGTDRHCDMTARAPDGVKNQNKISVR